MGWQLGSKDHYTQQHYSGKLRLGTVATVASIALLALFSPSASLPVVTACALSVIGSSLYTCYISVSDRKDFESIVKMEMEIPVLIQCIKQVAEGIRKERYKKEKCIANRLEEEINKRKRRNSLKEDFHYKNASKK